MTKIHTRVVLVLDVETDDRVDMNGRLGYIARNVSKIQPGLTAEFVGFVQSQTIHEPVDHTPRQSRTIDAYGFEHF